MKKLNLAVLALLATSCLNSALAASLFIAPSDQNVTLGNSLSVNLMYDAEGNNLGLGTFDIVFGYDSTILSFTSVTFGTGLDVFGLGDIQSATPTVGSINLSETSLDTVADILSNQPNSFKLATFTFSTLSAGANQWGVSINAIGDANGNSLSTSVTPSTFNVLVSNVPETDTYLMLMAGLGVMGLGLKNRKFRV